MIDLNITLIQTDLIWEDKTANLKILGNKITSIKILLNKIIH